MSITLFRTALAPVGRPVNLLRCLRLRVRQLAVLLVSSSEAMPGSH